MKLDWLALSCWSTGILRRSDRFANVRFRSLVVERDGTVFHLNAKLCPELVKIYGIWFVAHLVVKVAEDGCACGFIAHRQRFTDIPIFVDVPATAIDAAQRVF